MSFKDILRIFIRPRVCTWSIMPPLNFWNGKPKTRPTPLHFDLFFFQQHNALSNPQEAAKAKLIALFNIRFIIVQQIRAFIHSLLGGETTGERSRCAPIPGPRPEPTNKSLLGLTAARVQSGTKNVPHLNKRPTYQSTGYVL